MKKYKNQLLKTKLRNYYKINKDFKMKVKDFLKEVLWNQKKSKVITFRL